MIFNPTIKPRFEWKPRIKWEHPLAKGLVGCWLMNEGAGLKIFDATGHNTGIGSGTTWSSNALSFAAGGYIDCGQITLLTQLTLVVTFKVSVLGAYQYLVGKRDTGTMNYGFYVNVDNRLALRGGGTTDLYSVGTVSAGRIYRGVATINGTAGKLFINGALNNSGSVNGLTTVTPSTLIGARWSTYPTTASYSISGNIFEASIYNRALSAAEIAELYRAPYQFLEVPVRRSWLLGETTTAVRLTGAISTSLSAAGSLRVGKLLTGSASVSVAASGAIRTSKRFSGSASLTLSISGALTTPKRLSGAISGSVSTSGDLSVGKRLAGLVQLDCTVSGALSAERPLSGGMTLTVSVSGRLRDHDAYTMPAKVFGEANVPARLILYKPRAELGLVKPRAELILEVLSE